MDPLLSVIFFLSTFLSINSASELSYKDHCNSFVSYSTPSNKRVNTFPLGDNHNGYFQVGEKITGLGNGTTWSRFSFYLQPRTIQATEASHLFKVKGLVSFRSTIAWNFTHVGSRSHRSRRIYHGSDLVNYFKLEGFWSESSGKVCMVGRGTRVSETGEESHDLEAVFKLNNVFKSSNINSMVIGTLESLSSENDKSYFEPISVFMFPNEAYNYTLDSTEADKECSSGIDAEQGLSLISNSLSFCSYSISRAITMLPLEYSADCNSPKNCTPIDGSSEQLPTLMSLKGIQCSHSEKHRMRVLLEFSNNSFHYGWNQDQNPKNMLVGEGWWNKKSNVLCVAACHIKEISSSSDGTHVGDCSVRLRLRFPSILSIKNTSSIVGEIWSNKTAKEQGYFKRIKFRNDELQVVAGHGLEYEYSQLERVNKSCQNSKPVKGKGKSYPEAYSYDMRFDMSVGLRESRKRVAWGYATPLFVGDQFYDLGMPIFSDSVSSFSNQVPQPYIHNNNGSLFNISYKISLAPYSLWELDGMNSSFSNKSFEAVKLAAEGIYDAEGGTLCMVGCRELPSKDGTITHSLDCEVLVNFQFPPLDATDGRRIRGSIKSTRKKSDPLYFKPLDLSSSTYYMRALRRNAWRMDLEVIIALISTTLACVFVGLQLYHVKKNPDVLPFVSTLMMLILTFGYMIPLVLNLEALLSQDPNNEIIVYGYGGWLKVDEIVVRLTTMVAFLLQFRLLYLTWSSRKTNVSKEGFWNAEKKASFAALALYAAGLLVVFLFKLKKNRPAISSMYTTGYYYYSQEPSSWEYFKSYGGLVMDGFLLPQIILNILSNTKRAQILSSSFYIGTTFVRVLPHAYDLYRAHNYAVVDDFEYLYADPGADFYSTAWDIVIPLGGMLFAVIVNLQQRFGGVCVMPQRLKGSFAYEKVPVETELEGEVQTTNM
ncbi:hypothetical protein PIB30_045363 [Stylosanthes scabra]|uniref:RING-type E3 ubiquitin transferase n=1 Tax=Stylosanthes scabra TaxID=79078 RepID=A0ABU6SG59_9FABA|nr:hypothetical protein [Stylosanthes scabra]